jgi:2-methylcitrate dehydratase
MAAIHPDPTIAALLDFAKAARRDRIPDPVAARACNLMLDSIGNAAAGSGTEVLRSFRSFARPSGGRQLALIGTGQMARPEDAILINGTALRVQDFNDAYLGRDCAGDACHLQDVHSAMLAVAAVEHRSLAELITASVLAYEVMIAACEAYAIHARTHFDQSIYTALAVAVGAASLMRLDDAQTASAVAIAVASNIGLGQTRRGSLSMWKSAQVPYAAKAAVEACQLAQAGITGPEQVFTGQAGLLAALGYPSDTALDLDVSSATYRTLDGAMKKFPANYLSQPAIEAAIECRSELDLREPSAVRAVTVRTFEFALRQIDEEKFAPTTRETADHSSPYLIAVALTFGTVDESHYSGGSLSDRALLGLARKITFEPQPVDTGAGYPESLLTTVEVILDDGRTAVAMVDVPAGHSRRPFTTDELVDKFRRQSRLAWPVERQEQIERFLLGSNEQSDLSDLDELLGAP